MIPLLVLGLLGCGELVEGTETPAAPALPPPIAKKVEDKVEGEEHKEGYAYNPAGKRDPFESFLGSRALDPTVPSTDAPPLQRWDVERYVVRGIIFGTDSPRALIVDPEGIGHVVRLGSYVGRNWGKVTSIVDQVVVVTEEFKTLEDELQVNSVELRLGVGGSR